MSTKLTVVACLAILGCAAPIVRAQAASTVPGTSSTAEVNRALDLAEKGKCEEALPALTKLLHRIPDKALEFEAGMAAARCAMSLNRMDAVVTALVELNRRFPNDPRVLYVTAHYFSELANRSSQALVSTAPQSKEAMELDAEGYESQGKWDEATREYEMILARDPKAAGIHYRLGRILLSKPPNPVNIEGAKSEFESELKLHPDDAPSEFLLGDLARQAQQWDEAAAHFSRATQIDAGFSEAFLGLGIALNGSQKYSEAVKPLEKYVGMEPSDSAGHYQLAIAYGRLGRSQDAARQIALQQRAEKAQGARASAPQ